MNKVYIFICFKLKNGGLYHTQVTLHRHKYGTLTFQETHLVKGHTVVYSSLEDEGG